MISSSECDFVQDVTTDCSVVASLSAAVNVLTGRHEVGTLRPYFYSFLSDCARFCRLYCIPLTRPMAIQSCPHPANMF